MRPVRSIIVALSIAAIVVTGCSANRGGGPADVPATTGTETTTGIAQGEDTGQSSGQGAGSASGSPAATGSGSSSGSIRTAAEVKAAVDTATAFMRREVGMTTPVASNFRWTGTRSAKLDVRARLSDGGTVVYKGPVTVVSLQRLSKVWYVTGTSTAGIRVSSPDPGDRISSPVKVRGAAHTFEGNVRVRVTQDRYGKDVLLGTGNVTGRGDQLGPFSGSIGFAKPTGTSGSLVFDEPSALDGSPVAATVVRIRFAKSSPSTPSSSPLVGRISDPKVAADRLVGAWVRADKEAASKVATRSVVEQLFSEDRSGEDPGPGTCKLTEPARFDCTYPMGEAKLRIVVVGGASAGYLVTGFSITG